MKKLLYSLALLPALLMGGCAKEEISFDHEQPAFETKDGMILMEVIVPSSTKADDEIYIAGAFNGGDEAAAASGEWRLERSEKIDLKWGIYLDPSKFVDGKTLADGYHFISKKEREEVDGKGDQVKRILNPAPGTRTNLYVSKWASYFDVPLGDNLPDHDGIRIYYIDETGWDAIALYMWGDQEFCGGWPGATPAGSITFKGVEYGYFEFGDGLFGLTENLIFNNNGNGSQTPDLNITFEAGVANYFVKVTAEGAAAIADPSKEEALPAHDGVRVYAIDESGWDEIALYQWGGVNNFGGDWPGAQVAGTITFKGVTYKYFEYTDEIYGLSQNLIFNNNNNGIQHPDVAVTFAEGTKDYFFHITADGATQIANPSGEGGEVPEQPEEPAGPVQLDPVHSDGHAILIADYSGWSVLAIYAYGDGEIFNGWPGSGWSEEVEVGGIKYKKFYTGADNAGLKVNLIVHNNAGQQFDLAKDITLDKDYYYAIKAPSGVEVDPDTFNGEFNEDGTPGSKPTVPVAKIFVEDNTGWDGLSLYCWGSSEVFGGWPGQAITETVQIGGKCWKVLPLMEMPAGEFHLIFNNNGAGIQLEAFDCLAGEWGAKYMFYSLAEGSVTVPATPAVRINITNNTGWDAVALYAWGDAEVFGGWPGKLLEGSYIELAPEHFGSAENLIFNNNGAGTQYDGPSVTLDHDLNIVAGDGSCTLE